PRALGRRAEATRTGSAAAIGRRRLTPGRTRQLPRHQMEALARTVVARDAEDGALRIPRSTTARRDIERRRHARRTRRLDASVVVRDVSRRPSEKTRQARW